LSDKKLILQAMNILLHYILKLIYLITARTYYSKITVLNLEKVPVNEPLLIAINHSNAFWDGVMVGLHTKQRIWFLARGDVFKKPFAAKILNALGIAPIYRMQEGIQNMEKNKEVFNRCYQILSQNQSIAIFPEGNCERESKLRPLKKGTSRIAHGAIESFTTNKSLYITCAGLNYDDPDNLNSEVMLNFSDPIKVNDFLDASKPLSSIDALILTKDVEQRLDAVMYNVYQNENHKTFHFIRRNFLSLIVGKHKGEKYKFEKVKELSEKINTCPETLQQLNVLIATYIELLDGLKLREKYVNKYLVNRKFIDDYIVFLLLFIPALPGLFLNSWPYLLAFKTAKKVVKKQEFFSSVNIGAAGLIYFLWYLVLFIVLLFFLPMIKSLMLLVVLHFSGIIALHLASYFRALRAHLRISKLNKSDKVKLLESRQLCIDAIQKFVQI